VQLAARDATDAGIAKLGTPVVRVNELAAVETADHLADTRCSRAGMRRRPALVHGHAGSIVGIAIRFAKLPIAAVLRSRTLLETRGFIKVLVEANGDRILGFTMIGSEAGEVMAVVQTAMLAGLPHTRLRDAIIAHPTMAEGLTTLFANLPPR
jgi:hypothetical protein